MWHPVPGQVPLRENRTDVSEAPRHLSLIFTSKHFVHIIGKYAFQLSVSGAQQKGWEPHPAATKWSQEARGVCSESEGFYACKDTWACHSVAIWWILWFGLFGFFLLFFFFIKNLGNYSLSASFTDTLLKEPWHCKSKQSKLRKY